METLHLYRIEDAERDTLDGSVDDIGSVSCAVPDVLPVLALVTAAAIVCVGAVVGILWATLKKQTKTT